METTMTPTKIRKNGNTKIVDMKSGFRDKVTKVNSYEVGVKPDRRGNGMTNNLSNEIKRIIIYSADDKNLISFLEKAHSELSRSQSKLTVPFQMDLTDDSVKEIYKYYDSPNTAKNIVDEIGHRIYIVRPLEQTSAQRQTGAYQQTQLFDTLEGNTLPNADIVIRIDKPFNGITYCYDGQHGTLTSKDAESKTFYLADTIDELNKKETESYDFTYSPIWTDVDKFRKQWNEETFTLKDLCSFSSVIRNAVESDQKRVLVGQVHFTDGQGASQLIRKRNEHISSHSNSQRTKSECNGTKINDVLYDREYEINEPNEGVFPVTFTNNSYALSEIIPKIELFNQTGLKRFPSGTIPKKFFYNLRSKNYELMNYDQYLVFFYNTFLSFIEKDSDTGTYIFKKPSMSINSLRNNVSDFSLGDFWATYSIKPNVVDKWVSVFKSLEFEEDELFNVVQDLIHIANHSTKKTFTKKLSELNNLIKHWADGYNSDMKQILKDANLDDEKMLTDAKRAEYKSLKDDRERIKKLLFNTKDQFINLVRLSIQTKPSTQSITKWTEGIIGVMISGFKTYYEGNSSLFLGGSTGTLHRFNNIDKVFLNKAFVDKVKEETTSSDTSLWSRSEGKKYLDILGFEGINLYYCHHSKGYVTIENFESHHLSFRSKNPQKKFEFWFPLSSKYNNYISDDEEKNIVNDGGNFIDACKFMLKQSETERDLTDDDNLYDIYEDNISTFKKWIRKAERHLGV